MAGAGYDISASLSSSSSAATGAQRTGAKTVFNGSGGSLGVSWTTIALLAGAAAAVWFFFFRRKGGR